MTTVGSGKYTYELIQDWPKLPPGEALGVVSSVASDSQDRIYAFQRQDPPVMVFDRDGNYLDRWGIGAISDPHGITIVDDIVYITDRSDHVAVKFTLDGKPLQVIEDLAFRIDKKAVDQMEMASLLLAGLSPRLQELPVSAETVNSCITVAIGHVNIPRRAGSHLSAVIKGPGRPWHQIPRIFTSGVGVHASVSDDL